MRKLRRTGLIALAVLALSSLWAASASAQQAEFEAGAYPAKITGTQEGLSFLTTVQGTINCNTSLAGEIAAPTKVASLSLTGTCEAFGGKYPIKMNGCNAELTPGWNAFGFGSSGCGPITLQIFNCTVTIPSQDGLYATYANSGGGVTVSLQSKRLRYSGCKAADNEGGSFNATWKLSGVSMGFPFEESLFAAEKYTTSLVGSQVAASPHEIGLDTTTVKCSTATVSGSLSAASNPLVLTPAYSGCQLLAAGGGSFASVTMVQNGCNYENYLEEGGSNYTMAIACPVGNVIQVKAGTCQVTIPAQSGLKSVNYANIPSSSTSRSAIEVLTNVSGLTYTVVQDGFLCPLSGTGTKTTGTFKGNTLVEGLNAEGRPRNIKIGV